MKKNICFLSVLFFLCGIILGCSNNFSIDLTSTGFTASLKKIKNMNKDSEAKVYFRSISLTQSNVDKLYEALTICEGKVILQMSELRLDTLENTNGYALHSLKGVELPRSLTKLGECAFAKADYLQTVTFNEYYDGAILKKIGDCAFLGCSSLTKIKLPNSLEEIGNYAFYDTSLSSIEIPSSVKKIGDYAFQIDGAKTLKVKNITVYAKTPPEICPNSFIIPRDIDKIKVPVGYADVYKNAPQWKNYASKIVENNY